MSTNNTQDDLEKALKRCAEEPIHIPGSIQPHGYLLVVDDNFTILKASKNFLEFSGNTIEQLIGTRLSTYTHKDSIKTLKSLVIEGPLSALRYCTVTLEHAGKQQLCDAVVHCSDSVMIVEFEPQVSDDQQLDNQDFYEVLMRFSVNLHKIRKPVELYSYLVDQIRKLTGFGRVVLYRFDNNWNGDVIAEARLDNMDSYLGLSFPASDIPEQARKLYSVNYLRLISDSGFTPVQILPDDKHENGAPIDLSFSCLRSVSPVHLEYLKNMGVESSMSISVMQNDRLWGLVACHHDKPFRPAYPVRMAAELLTHNFSAFLSNYSQLESNTREKLRESQLRELKNAIDLDKPIIETLSENHQLLMNLTNSDGFLIKLGDKQFSHGDVPEAPAPALLTAWIENNCDDSLFVSNAIVTNTGLKEFKDSGISGAIVGPVSHAMENHLMFFKREQSMEKFWAGEPEKNVSQTSSGFKLTPRASFERWKQITSGASKHWSDAEIDMVTSINQLVLEKFYEDSLRKVTDNLDAVVKNSNALIYIVDTHGMIVQMNETALKSFALEAKQVVGQHFSAVFDQQLADIVQNRISSVMESGESSRVNEHFVQKETEFHLATVNFPLHDSVNNILAICSIATDVSELYQIQEDLSSSNKELERLAIVASHDLQEPIRLISIFANLLKEDYKDKLDEQAEEYIDYMLNSSDRMQVLIHDLLQYSRLETKEIAPPFISAYDVLLDVVNELRLTEQLGDAVITIAPNLPSVQMKSEHFACLMQNIIGNSLKYKKENRPVKLIVYCHDSGSHWHFSVKDNGIGIDEENLKDIFVIFKRLHTQDEYKGTGIGLAICTKIIENHNGKIWVESTLGESSTFHFTIQKKFNVPISQDNPVADLHCA